MSKDAAIVTQLPNQQKKSSVSIPNTLYKVQVAILEQRSVAMEMMWARWGDAYE